MKKYLTHNGNLIYRGNNHFVYRNYTPSNIVNIFGRDYRTVTVNGETWLAENFAYNDGNGGIYTRQDPFLPNTIGCWYTAEAAVRVSNLVSGWHLPSKSEWENLAAYAATLDTARHNEQYALASTSGWQSSSGLDICEMTCYPCGWYENGREGLVRSQARFWCSTKPNTNYYNFYIYYGSFESTNSMLGWESSKSNSHGMSIRLKKDT